MHLRLGVVMAGTGAHAAACVGVLGELAARGIEPFAVCGLGAGVWPAALFASGYAASDMEKALVPAARLGRRMLAPSWYERLMHLPSSGAKLNCLLGAQTGQRVLSLCPRAALFPCRMARSGQRVLFSTRAFMQEGSAMLAMQASVGFAARAAMTVPPFLAPLQFMGSELLGDPDAAFACRQLLALGAHRVLVIAPHPSSARTLDALELAAALQREGIEQPLGEHCAVLRMTMPAACGALSLERIKECAQAGALAAKYELDAALSRMGMAQCRVLPFRRRMV